MPTNKQANQQTNKQRNKHKQNYKQTMELEVPRETWSIQLGATPFWYVWRHQLSHDMTYVPTPADILDIEILLNVVYSEVKLCIKLDFSFQFGRWHHNADKRWTGIWFPGELNILIWIWLPHLLVLPNVLIELILKVWRQFPDRIVGFPSRTHFWENSTARFPTFYKVPTQIQPNQTWMFSREARF